jgi:hypothetical protein
MRTASSGTRVGISGFTKAARCGLGMASARAADQDREMDPELVALVKRLRRRNPKTGERKSLRSIAAELAKLGYVNFRGRPFGAESINGMLRT